MFDVLTVTNRLGRTYVAPTESRYTGRRAEQEIEQKTLQCGNNIIMKPAPEGSNAQHFNSKMLILICFIVQLVTNVESRCISSGRVLAFAGGGFGTNPKIKSNKFKQRKARLSEVSPAPSPSSTNDKLKDDSSPKIDKWGLPVLTADDLFPPMPPGTEIIPVDASKSYPLTEIQDFLKDHIDLRLHRIFDDNGIEKDSKGRIPMTLRLLHQSPPVLAIDNFFTTDECEKTKDAIGGAYQVNSATFKGALSTRTSTSWFCHYSQVPALLAKAHHVLNIPYESMEEPQVVRYKKGQEFSWHYDEVPLPQLDNGGQRLATLLVYLTDVPSRGGGTVFRDLEFQGRQLTMQPKQGSALLFFPAFRDGKADDRTLHKSEVISGDEEKWIVQMWIHQRKYQAVLPEGNSHEAAQGVVDEISRTLGYV